MILNNTNIKVPSADTSAIETSSADQAFGCLGSPESKERHTTDGLSIVPVTR
jgi:hypothetical protein